MDTLNPCASCGRSSAEVLQRTENQDYGEEVFIVVCQCGDSTEYFYLRDDAIAAWNKPA